MDAMVITMHLIETLLTVALVALALAVVLDPNVLNLIAMGAVALARYQAHQIAHARTENILVALGRVTKAR